ncbi:VPLPA-CTERM protein sorting domain-containing protein [Roseovarius litoreus]|uniref:VPLPA-CTERM protein sorting domain-containing protein n=1 Tax=Roseovarius litoreus TaxID=1155722 RepID=A0A1M7E8P9_9RHOB|nr:VPLPA-CTERM sorting domain-containing protein [Roseovarius litoreus]SHL87968.1 VPLPA-CTERM protein sorting domain-containing protein [Roseovarius litoreus]
MKLRTENRIFSLLAATLAGGLALVNASDLQAKTITPEFIDEANGWGYFLEPGLNTFEISISGNCRPSDDLGGAADCFEFPSGRYTWSIINPDFLGILSATWQITKFDTPPGFYAENFGNCLNAGRGIIDSRNLNSINGLATTDSEGGLVCYDTLQAERSGGYNFASEYEVAIEFNISTVPIPATLPLLAGAVAGFGFLRRRKTRR